MYTIYAIIYQIDELNQYKGQYWHVYHLCYHLSNWWTEPIQRTVLTCIPWSIYAIIYQIDVSLWLLIEWLFPRFHHFLISYFLFPNFPFLVLSLPHPTVISVRARSWLSIIWDSTHNFFTFETDLMLIFLRISAASLWSPSDTATAASRSPATAGLLVQIYCWWVGRC